MREPIKTTINCPQEGTQSEKRLVAYLDGKLHAHERREFEAHLAICVACRERAEGFRSLWDVLEDLPAIAPSPAFDAMVRARVQQEVNRAGFWSWIVPSPRIALAATALLIASVWLSTFQPTRLAPSRPATTAVVTNAEAEFGMIKDLPVLEDYDVVTTFDALSELPVQQPSQPEPTHQM
jgi:anti-sigma factor RsiW